MHTQSLYKHEPSRFCQSRILSKRIDIKCWLLQNLCIAAAYRPIREILEKEKKAKEEGREVEKVVAIRELRMEDMRQAKLQVNKAFLHAFLHAFYKLFCTLSCTLSYTISCTLFCYLQCIAGMCMN
jgi:hypothetical protein